jgi:hypothetical protein
MTTSYRKTLRFEQFFALLIVSFLVLGCHKQNDPVQDAEFSKLRDASMEELRLKTTTNTSWGLGKFDRWDLDQDTGLLVFSNRDGSFAKCPAQIIGSYNSDAKTWLWAWANSSARENLTGDSLKIKAFGQQHGYSKLIEAEWQGTEDDAWAMVAITTKLCGAAGAYRGPASSNLFVFMTFGKVELGKK